MHGAFALEDSGISERALVQNLCVQIVSQFSLCMFDRNSLFDHSAEYMTFCRWLGRRVIHATQNNVRNSSRCRFIRNIGVFIVHEKEIHEVASYANELCANFKRSVKGGQSDLRWKYLHLCVSMQGSLGGL